MREPSVRVSSPPVMGLNAQAAGQAGELQGAAEVGVGQGQGRIPVLPGPGQQFVDVGRSCPEGIEALDVEFHVTGGHGGPGL